MCDNLLIDLSGWNEPVKEEIVIEEPVLVEANSFKGPYDPFDSVEKEACLMGLKLPRKPEKTEIETQDFQCQYADQDLNNEPPPDALLDESVIQSPEDQLAKPSEALCPNSPPHNSKKLFRDVMLDNLQMIAAESPIKFVEDEPISITAAVSTSASNPSDYECSNAEFEERLKNLRIALTGTNEKLAPHTSTITTDKILAKANSVNVERPAHGHVEGLLQILKSLVYENVEPAKRKEFEFVIDRLRITVNAILSSVETSKQPAADSPHTAYTRQATFDLQLQQQQQNKTPECMTESEAGRKVDVFPDAMTCSSATYDGEPLAPVPLPIIDSEQPKSLPEICVQKPDSYMSKQVNDNLMLQINELLERHNLQTNEEQPNQEYDHNNETKTGSASTVILIVNSTATGNQIPSCIVHPTTNTTATPAPVVVASNSSSSNSSNGRASTYRRRSSSLSIHDKAKPERTKPFVNQNVPPKELLSVGDKVSAMTSFRQRRNSYSIHSTAAKGGASSLGVGKSAAINESTTPTKAVIPTKRVMPRVKPLNVSTAANSHLNTPMPSRTKPGGQMFCTSTPMPQTRAQQRRSLRPVSSYSNTSTSISSGQPSSYSKRPTQ